MSTASAKTQTGLDIKFSAVEETIYSLFRLNQDVAISALYAVVSGQKPEESELTFRQQQQAVGKYISRINAKIISRRETILPGLARRTYRLCKMRDK